MPTLRRCFDIFLVFAFLVSSQVTAQNACTNQAQSKIEENVRDSLQFGPGVLYQTQRTDLENELKELQFVIKAQPKPSERIKMRCIRVSDIRRQGINVENNGFVTDAAMDVDDVPMWRVAYDCKGTKIFHLYGFKDDVAGLNNLIDYLELNITTDNLAQVEKSSVLALSYEGLVGAEVRNELDLMIAVRQSYIGDPSLAKFLLFLKQCPQGIRGKIKPPVVASTPTGFRIIFFSFREGILRQNSMVINSDGKVSMNSDVLFTWGVARRE